MIYIYKKLFNLCTEYCCSQVQVRGTPVRHRQLHSNDERLLGSSLQATWHHGCDPQGSHGQECGGGQSSHHGATWQKTSSQLEQKMIKIELYFIRIKQDEKTSKFSNLRDWSKKLDHIAVDFLYRAFVKHQ